MSSDKDLLSTIFRDINKHDELFWEALSKCDTGCISEEKTSFGMTKIRIDKFLDNFFQVKKKSITSNQSNPLNQLGLSLTVKIPTKVNNNLLDFSEHRKNIDQLEMESNPYVKLLVNYYLSLNEKIITSKSDMFKLILSGYNYMIEKMFGIVPASIKIEASYNYDAMYGLVNSSIPINNLFNIVSMELQPRDVLDVPKLTKNYILYLLVFKSGDKIFSQPIYLRDKETSINKFGLYDDVYYPGLYINKPYDYDFQCTITPDLNKYLKYKGKDVCYYFVSEFYESVYPMNNPELISFIESNIKTNYKMKYRKYIINYD